MMAKKAEQKTHERVIKKTSQGGRKPKTAGMNKNTRRNRKPYRGQGR
jgi:hypothetical protein